MQEKIVILDFGSQTTQLIARRVRELNTYCEILPYNKFPEGDESVKGVILSGSPFSVYDESVFKADLSEIRGKYPILGICYGAQFIAYTNGGKVEPAGSREYGRAHLSSFDKDNVLFKDVKENTQVWMSHGDTITVIPSNFKKIASTDKVAIAAYQIENEKVWGVQFHPEVFHSEDGTQMLKNFVVDVCGCKQDCILSGSPFSVYDESAFKADLSEIRGKYPILGICYGAQFIAYTNGGKVEPAGSREYGRAHLSSFDKDNVLFKDVKENTQVWMSHGDTITVIPSNFKKIASTDKVAIAAYQIENEKVWGVQFHPEVFHSEDGTQMLKNFVVDVCGCKQDWSAASFIETTVAELKEQLGDDKVVLGLSGGVDSSVAAVLLNRAIGKNLTCIFVDHGMLRKNEFKNVLHDYECLGLNVIGVDASAKFFAELAGVTEPEEKRKIIGKGFIEVFDEEAHKIKDVKWLAQGTIYPDCIESLSITGTVIKSHHNVGGLPEKMHLKLCEPLRLLFKDEVRRVGRGLGMPEHLITRHPFPGPGLAVRILGDITPEKVAILQNADDIFIQGLRDWKVKEADGSETSLYHQVWQAGVILLPVQSVGVMGDERTYERAIALRAVTSTDAMTADWAHLPYEFLGKVSNDIINKVKGVNRVTYDISSKPPATIEWE